MNSWRRAHLALLAVLHLLFGTAAAQAQQGSPGIPCCGMWGPGWMHRDNWAPQHMAPVNDSAWLATGSS